MLNFTAMALAAIVGLAADGAAVTSPAPAARPPAAQATAKPAADPMDQMVCRTVQETGTLIGGDRVCHSRREWAAMSRESRKILEETQQRGQMVRLPGN